MTGVDGDSTKEEKKRGITIDLSFSNLSNGDTNIAFIDVPGHEKLLKNMIAGAFGFDACLLVVDACELIMPQTKEHLEVLNLLGVRNILVALTKIDLIPQDEVKAKKEIVQEFLRGFRNLELIDIIPTSIKEPRSIKNLENALFHLPQVRKKSSNVFRYYIDRSFSIAGAGSVVTGTVLSGEVRLKDRLFVCELGKEVQVKNLQVHEQNVELASTSQRLAINLANNKLSLKRGLLLSKKGYLRGFESVDVYLESIDRQEVRHNSTLIAYIGTKQITAKVLLYSKDSIKEGFAKLKFNEKVFSIFNEPIILTLNSRVVAGAKVLSPINEPLKKKHKMPLLKALQKSDFKKAFEILVKSHKRGFGLISSNQRFGLTHQEAIEIAKEIDNIFVDEKNLVLYSNEAKEILKQIILDIYKQNIYALLSVKSICLKLKWASESLVLSILEEFKNGGVLEFENGVYKSASVEIENIDRLIEDRIYQNLEGSKISPKAPNNIFDDLNIDRQKGNIALKALAKSKKVVRLSHNIFVSNNQLTILISELKDIIRKDGYIEISNFKTYYPNLSRKYIIAYLEYLDLQKDIKKEGNRRVLT